MNIKDKNYAELIAHLANKVEIYPEQAEELFDELVELGLLDPLAVEIDLGNPNFINKLDL